jgi:hypothetical protein
MLPLGSSGTIGRWVGSTSPRMKNQDSAEFAAVSGAACVFEERVLHCSGDRFERGCQPPLKPLAIEVHCFGPKLLAIALDRLDKKR